MSSAPGEWGHRLATPDITEAAGLFFNLEGEMRTPHPEANVMPPEGYMFAARLAPIDTLLVSTIAIDNETLHPRPVHYKVWAGDWVGQIVLGNRVRFFHNPAVPVMDLIGRGQSDSRTSVRLIVDSPPALEFIRCVSENETDKDGGDIMQPADLLAGALKLLHLPALTPDARRRLAAQKAALRRTTLPETAPPTSRQRE